MRNKLSFSRPYRGFWDGYKLIMVCHCKTFKAMTKSVQNDRSFHSVSYTIEICEYIVTSWDINGHRFR